MQHLPGGYPTQPAVAPPPYLPQYLYPNHYSSPYPNPSSAAVDTYAASVTATSALTYSVAASSQTYDASFYVQAAGDATSVAGYYQDPTAQNWPITYASGVATSGTPQLVASQVKSNPWKDAAMRKLLKKRKNPVQHAWCDVCKIEVTSKEILNSHKQGKKHQKNLEKLKATLAPASAATKAPTNSIIGPQENPSKRKLKEPEDLETKKKKVVLGGAAVSSVRTCEICNVVCNSDVVFRFHLAGQKHVAMMKGKMGP